MNTKHNSDVTKDMKTDREHDSIEEEICDYYGETSKHPRQLKIEDVFE